MSEQEITEAQEKLNWIDLNKTLKKTNPTLSLQVDGSLFKVSSYEAQQIQKLRKRLDKAQGTKIVSEVNELVDALKENNTKLDDCTIVFNNPDCAMDEASRSKALKLLNFESDHQVLEVTDIKLSETLRMEPGRFYVYYKPSITCGFQYSKFLPLANIHMTQALLKDYYRGELQVNQEQLDKVDFGKLE